MSFVPYCMVDSQSGCLVSALPNAKQYRVTGEVVYINHAHRWYRVQYTLPGVERPQYECFPFKTEPDPAMPYKHGYKRYPARLPWGEGIHATA